MCYYRKSVLSLFAVPLILTGIWIVIAQSNLFHTVEKYSRREKVVNDDTELIKVLPTKYTEVTSKELNVFHEAEAEIIESSNDKQKSINHSSLQQDNYNTANESDKMFMKRMEIRQNERKLALSSACKILGLQQKIVHRTTLLVFEKYKAVYCYIPKTGCTNAKKMLLELYGIYNLSHVPIHEVAEKKFATYLSPGKLSASYWQNFTKFVFVRHPFERLVSSYNDKVWDPPASFLENSKEIRRRYGNSSKPHENKDLPLFEEFIDFISDKKRKNRYNGMDSHWNLFNDICQPCAIPYDVIGRLETVEEDIKYVLKLMGVPSNITLDSGYSKTGESNSKSKTASYLQKLSQLQKKKLYEALKIDFELFDYAHTELN